jgi:hypothetical protein
MIISRAITRDTTTSWSVRSRPGCSAGDEDRLLPGHRPAGLRRWAARFWRALDAAEDPDTVPDPPLMHIFRFDGAAADDAERVNNADVDA